MTHNKLAIESGKNEHIRLADSRAEWVRPVLSRLNANEATMSGGGGVDNMDPS